jgi:two-component system nitrogen regulation response regulator NtrX
MSHSDEVNLKEDSPKTGGSILVVDDEKGVRQSLEIVLERLGHRVKLASGGVEGDIILAKECPDLILLDVRLPPNSGIDLLDRWRKEHPECIIVLMSGEATITEALQGLQMGAYDFLEKPFAETRLKNVVDRALERQRMREEASRQGDERIIGQSPSLRKVLADVEKVAPTKARVLITGESGTGKDLLARAIHNLSARKNNRMVKLNCAAMPAELIESQLFGHVKGAFTGALSAHKGLFEMANGGTLFLDEVVELPLPAQAKLLRALQNGEIHRVGSEELIKIDVRIIAATNRDLKVAVDRGEFREDLYYRLAVLQVACPPLRDRSEDVPLLVKHFCYTLQTEYQLTEKRFSDEAILCMQKYAWPGNIRELRNIVERTMILAGPIIGAFDLPSEISKSTNLMSDLPGSLRGIKVPMPWEEFKTRSEKGFLVATMRFCEGNVADAARILEVERSTVHKWMRSLGIEKEDYLHNSLSQT